MNSADLKGPLGMSIAAILAIVVFICLVIGNIASPLMMRSQEVSVSDTDALVTEYGNLVAADIAKFNGRSAFFKPIPIPRARPEPKDPVVHTPPPPPPPVPTGPPPAPATYLGPPMIALIGDEAWFRGSGSGMDSVIRIKVGEEKEGIKLVSTEEPTRAIVEYRRGEYELDLFSYEEPFFEDEAPTMSEPDFLEEVAPSA